MESRFNKDKYLRVIQKTDMQGLTVFKVQSARNLFDVILGIWDDYQKENETLEQAINQIQIIYKHSLTKQKVVHFEKRP
jgi:hypothetical protein